MISDVFDVDNLGMEFHRHCNQRTTRCDDQLSSADVDRSLEAVANRGHILVERGSSCRTAEEPAADIDPIEIEVELGDELGSELRRCLIDTQTLCERIPVHMETCNPHPCGLQLRHRCAELTVFRIEPETAVLSRRGALPRTSLFEIPVDAQTHGKSLLRLFLGELGGPSDLSLRIQVDD